jgi:ArsR family transcriptional regulator, arsenate/arsenite/antimonite-responsive transcriptional repressor
MLCVKYNFFEQVLKLYKMKSEHKFYEKAMSAVADPYRMSILNELAKKGEIRCCDVVCLTGLSQPTCSHHIKLLADSELIVCRKQGRNNIFTINKENFKKLGLYFEKFGS